MGANRSGQRVNAAIQFETVIEDVADSGAIGGGEADGVKGQGGTRVIRGRIVRVRQRQRIAFKETSGAPTGTAAEVPSESSPRPTRAVILLATAHRMQEMIDSGEVEGPADLARRLGVSRPRVTQVLNLALLAPEIQDEILDPDHPHRWSRREMSAISRSAEWASQRATRSI